MRHEQIWERLYWLLTPRGQSGYASHAIAALDLALWDLKGKALGQPCWRLLGGARAEVPVYATFGFAFFERDELAAAAQSWVERGFKRLKMTVGHHGLARRDEPRPLDALIAEDVQRIRAVREAVGPEVQIYIDANCSLDYFHALVARAAHRGIRHQLLRGAGVAERHSQPGEAARQDLDSARRRPERRPRQPLPRHAGGAGGRRGAAQRLHHRRLHAVRCASPAWPSAFNTRFANGGAWPHHNMHLHAGLANGSLVEYHSVAVDCCRMVFDDLPVPSNGVLALPERPGLGFEPNRERVAELAKRPGSRGVGKA